MSGARSWTPSPEHVQASEAVKSTRISRIALGLSVLFSILALAVSLVSFFEQRSINDDQKKINEEQRRVIYDARKDKLMEHAVRVSWWIDFENSRSRDVIYIQNRSLVPIRDVTLRYVADFTGQGGPVFEHATLHDGSPVIMLELIPPCTMVTMPRLEMENRFFGTREDRATSSGVKAMEWSRVDFSDAHGTWSIASGGGPRSLRPEDRIELGEEEWPAFDPFIEQQPATDCGTG